VLRIEDRAPVLHGAADDLAGSRDQVELRQRIGDAEIFIVIVQEPAGLFESVAGLAGVAALDDNADIHAIHATLDTLEVAYANEQQIGRHLRRLLEAHALRRRREARDLGDGHVGDGHAVLRYIDGHGEGRLAQRLVPAGQQIARIGGLEVGRERTARAIGAGVVHGEEALGGTAYRAVILDVKTVFPGGDDARKGERGTPEPIVEAHTGVGPTIEGGVVEGEPHRIQSDGRAGGDDLDGYRDLAGEGERSGIGHQRKVVVEWDDVIRQHFAPVMRCGRRCSRVRYA